MAAPPASRRSSGALRRRAVAILLASPLPFCGCAESTPREPPPRPDILFIVVDTLRADHLGFHGYERDTSPNLDALAERSTVFLNATSTAPWTNPAALSLFTGLHPAALGDTDRALALPDTVPSLTRLLVAEGYRAHGVVSHLYVGEQFGFDAGFASWDQENARGHGHVSSEAISDRALELLADLGADPIEAQAPFFLFLHYFDPHNDYFEHEGHAFSEGGPKNWREDIGRLKRLEDAGELEDADFQLLRDLYDSEVRFTDFHIGRVLDDLERRDLFDDALVVLVADHGEALGERPDRLVGHTITLHEEVAHVPLVVKLPGSRTRRDVTQPVSTVNLLPSIATTLELELPEAAGWAARSLLDGPPEAAVFCETENSVRLQSVRRGSWKLIHDLELGESRLFDLAEDPGEARDLAGERPEILRELEALRVDWSERNARLRELIDAENPELGEREIEQLRALGYTGF